MNLTNDIELGNFSSPIFLPVERFSTDRTPGKFSTTAIDATGLHALEALNDRLKRSGRTLLLCGARHQPAAFLAQAEFIEHVGKQNILPHIQAALERAHEIRSRFSGVGEEAAHDLERTSL